MRLEQDEPWRILPGEEVLGGCSVGQVGLPPNCSQLLEALLAELPRKTLVKRKGSESRREPRLQE